MASNHYALLGLPYDATPEEIRSAYFLLARTLHPDVNADPEAREKFLAVQKAYDVLSNPKKRDEYDATLPVEARFVPKISVHTQYSLAAIPLMEEPQLVY